MQYFVQSLHNEEEEQQQQQQKRRFGHNEEQQQQQQDDQDEDDDYADSNPGLSGWKASADTILVWELHVTSSYSLASNNQPEVDIQ